MDKEPKKKSAPEQTEQRSGGLWGIGIYLCLAAVVISLIFASCTGGAVYNPKTPEVTPTPLIDNAN